MDQAPPSTGSFQVSAGSTTIRGWHALVLIALLLAAWTSTYAYAFTSTTAAWNEFDQAPTCALGQVTDECRAVMLLTLTLDNKSKSSCFVDAHPIKGIGTLSGAFSKGTCHGLYDLSRVQGTIWKGQLVQLPGTAPWVVCVGFSPRACTGAWSDNSAMGAHWSALSGLLIALPIDAGFALLAVFYVIGKGEGWVRYRVRH
jgi:hypothetical protein